MSARALWIAIIVSATALTAGVFTARGVFIERDIGARRERDGLVRRAEMARELEITYVQEAAAIRAFVLAGKAQSLKEYNERRAEASHLHGRLRRALSGSPDLERFDAASDAAEAWDAAIQDLIAGETSSDRANVLVNRYRASPAAERFQRLATTLSQLRSAIDASVNPATRKAEVAGLRVSRLTMASIAAAVSSLAAAGALFVRLATSRMRPPLSRHEALQTLMTP